VSESLTLLTLESAGDWRRTPLHVPRPGYATHQSGATFLIPLARMPCAKACGYGLNRSPTRERDGPACQDAAEHSTHYPAPGCPTTHHLGHRIKAVSIHPTLLCVAP
jgi:hypothetical protein